MEKILKPNGYIKIKVINKITGKIDEINIKNMVVQNASIIIANCVAKRPGKNIDHVIFGLTNKHEELDTVSALRSASTAKLDLEEIYFVDTNKNPIEKFEKNENAYLVKGVCFCFKTEDIISGTKIEEAGLFSKDDTMFSYKPIENFIVPPDSIISVEWTIMF